MTSTGGIVYQVTLHYFCYFSVVYEHKSRLERSLQTEKMEHKKTRDGKHYIYRVYNNDISHIH